MSADELSDALFNLSDSPIKTSDVPEEALEDLEFNSNQFWKVESSIEDLEDLE